MHFRKFGIMVLVAILAACQTTAVKAKGNMSELDIWKGPLIDAHSQIDGNIDIKKVVPMMDLGGVSQTILSARFKYSSSKVLAFAEKHPGRIVPAAKSKNSSCMKGWGDFPGVFLREVQQGRFQALAEVILWHGTKGNRAGRAWIEPDDDRVMPFIKAAREHKWPLILNIEFARKESGVDLEQMMAKFEGLLKNNRDLFVGLNNMDQLEAPEVNRLIEAHPNIFFITSHADPLARRNKIASKLVTLSLDTKPLGGSHTKLVFAELLRLLVDARDFSRGNLTVNHRNFKKPVSVDMAVILTCFQWAWDPKTPAFIRSEIYAHGLKAYYDLKKSGSLQGHPEEVRVLLSASLLYFLSDAHPLACGTLTKVRKKWNQTGTHQSYPYYDKERKILVALEKMLKIRGLNDFKQETDIPLENGNLLLHFTTLSKPKPGLPQNKQYWIQQSPSGELISTYILTAYPDKDKERWGFYHHSFGNKSLLKFYGGTHPALIDVQKDVMNHLSVKSSRSYAYHNFSKEVESALDALIAGELSMHELEVLNGKANGSAVGSKFLTMAETQRLLPVNEILLRSRLQTVVPSLPYSSTDISVPCLDGTLKLTYKVMNLEGIECIKIEKLSPSKND